MSSPLSAAPPATAQGTLEKRPFVHLLVYVLEKRLSGSLVLTESPTSEAIVVFADGAPTKIKTVQLAPAPADAARLEALTGLADSTKFAFYEKHDALPEVRPNPVDPLPWVWRGLRRKPPREHVRAAMSRVGEAAVRLVDSDLSRFRFEANEEQLISPLRNGPARLAELAVRSRELVELLVYALLITKRATPESSLGFARPATPSGAIVPITMSTAPTPPVAPSVTPPVTPPEHAARHHEIVERAAAIDAEDYFQMLGVPRDATADAVREAYVDLVKTWHPDRLPAGLASARDACGRVFARLTEAHQTLTDNELRARYMRLLSEGGATPKDQETIAHVVEASTHFQKAEFFLKRGDYAQAEKHASEALELDPAQADYHALAAWLETVKPNISDAAVKSSIQRLTKAIELNEKCEKAHYYRGMLHKRTGNAQQAVRDFQRAADLNPRNVDALREVRLHEMRASKPPSRKTDPGVSPGSDRAPSTESKGLFGRLFKK